MDSVQVYGMWIDSTSELADARSLRGDQPDVIVRVAGHLSASHLIAWSDAQWPNRHVVREVIDRGWVAKQAP
jgi:hypothetical protein